MNDICKTDALSKLSSVMQIECGRFSASRTVKHWLYMKMDDFLHTTIKGEKTRVQAIWELHLQTVNDMLPIFAVGMHSIYMKSARIYL